MLYVTSRIKISQVLLGFIGIGAHFSRARAPIFPGSVWADAPIRQRHMYTRARSVSALIQARKDSQIIALTEHNWVGTSPPSSQQPEGEDPAYWTSAPGAGPYCRQEPSPVHSSATDSCQICSRLITYRFWMGGRQALDSGGMTCHHTRAQWAAR